MRKVERGSIWCPALRLHFPKIYRISRRNAKRARVDNARQHVGYTLDPSAMAALRGCLIEEIDRLDRDASFSLIVRHHWSRSLASSYLEGVEDVTGAYNSPSVFEADEAIFTLTERPTGADWPAPMIIYVAEIYGAENELGAEHFEVVVGPDGRPKPLALLG